MALAVHLLENPACIWNNCGKQGTKKDALRLHDKSVHQFQLEAHMPCVVNVGSVAHVQKACKTVMHWDGISWDLLTADYVKLGKLRHTAFAYEKKQEDVPLHFNGHTFVGLLKVYASLKDLETGFALHAELARRGLLERDSFIGSTLVDMYAKCGSIVKAQEAFDKLANQNVVSWTALIAGYTKLGHGDKALELVQKMQRAGVSPNSHTLVCSLKACGALRSRDKSKEMHAEIVKRGLESEVLIGNTLVAMYARCCLLDTAYAVLEKLPVVTVVPWNALITGYVEHGFGQEALHYFELMQQKGNIYDCITLSCCLKACGCVGATVMGERLHSEMYKAGLEKDHLINFFLLDMYAKCGSLVEAQQVLNKLSVQDVVSWTALITGYVKHGCDDKALHCFVRMQREGISPNTCTFICTLKACGNMGSLEMGERVYIGAVEKGFEKDLIISNTLIDLYAKCGCLATAQAIFGKLSDPDKISWNTLIAGYSEHDKCQEALHCFEIMQQNGICYDTTTLLCCLKACGGAGEATKGHEIHTSICQKGFDEDLLIGNSLVSMYSRCGRATSARHAFDKLLLRDIFSWNALLAGCGEYGHGCVDEALECGEIMHHEGVSPNAHTYVCFLKACGSKRDTHKVQELYVEAVKKGLEKEHLVGRAAIDAYSKCGLLGDALELFNRLQVKEIVSMTALIAGCIELGLGEEALTFFESMLEKGIFPDAVMLVYVLRACVYSGSLHKCQKIHADSARLGLEGDVRIGSILIDMYAKHGLVAEAYEVFKNLLICNAASWNALISGYAEQGSSEKALCCFDKMVLEGIPWDTSTIVCVLKTCGGIGASIRGQELHKEIVMKGLEMDLLVCNILVDFYSKCGMLGEALEVFDRVAVRDVVSWNAAIAAFAQCGESKYVLHSFKRMVNEGITPDLVSFMNALHACSHEGLVDEGWMCFGAISNEYGLVPTVEHHTCMADLLGRVGLTDQAGAIIQQMPLHPDMVGWFSVLGACQKWGNLELGRHTFKHAVLLDESHTSVYVCMSNMFAGVVQVKEVHGEG